MTIKKRKIMVLILAIVMMINLCIAPVLAEDVSDTPTALTAVEPTTVSENTIKVSTYEELVEAVDTINNNLDIEYRVEITADIALEAEIKIYGNATFVASGGDRAITIGTTNTDAKRFLLYNNAVVSFGEADAEYTLTITLGDGGSRYAIVAGFPYNDTTTGKSTLNLYDGVCITGKSGVGGVSAATINMHDGAEIKDNTVSERGSGVYLDANTVFNMYGGEISGNKTTNSKNAAAIYAENDVVINIYDGIISGNIAAGNGGAFYLNNSGVNLNISGGAITGNAAGSNYNGDVIYLNNSSATVTIEGDPIIYATDSDTTHAKMYYLNSSGSITCGELTEGASIDVPSTFTLGMTEENFEDYKGYFNAPEGYYAYYENGMLQLTNSGYTMTYDANGGTGDTTDSGSYTYNGTAIVATSKFTVPDDKEFNHWNTKADDTGDNYSEGSYIIIDDNVTLYAIWSDPTYTVNFVVDGKTYPVKVEQNEVISETLIPTSNKTGYEITGWYVDSEYSESAVDLTEKIEANTTLYAKLDPITYTLSFDTGDTAMSVTYDSEIDTLPTPTKENKVFSHWEIDGEEINTGDTWKIANDETATAVWDLADVQIVYTEQELKDALAVTSVTDIVVGANITITADITFDRAVNLYSNGDYTVDNADGTNYRFYVSAGDVNFGQSNPTGDNDIPTLTICLGGSQAAIAINNASSVLNLYDGILISGLDGSRGIALTTSGAVLNMYGGEISGITTSNLGAGVYLYTGGTIFNMYGGTIQNNTASGKDGGGVYITGTDSTFNMTGGTITGNYANNGGGVYGNSNTHINIDDGIITSNFATRGSGGGVYGNSGGTFSLTDSTITGNTSTSTGGGIYINNSTADKTAVITGNTITGNSSSSNNGGGIYFNGTTTMTISNNTITTNEANNGGGVFVNSASTVTMNDNTITENNARSGNGGGIYFNSTATVTMSGNTINDNEANNGGGMYVNGATITLDNTNKTIDSNEARSGSGGGIYITNSNSNVTVTGGTIDSNTATSNGGGVYINNNAGALLTVEDISITNNEANSGGGIYGHTNATVHVDTAIITDNKAKSGSGGGIYANTGSGTFSLVDSEIKNNTSTNTGGGVYAANSNAETEIDISRNTISKNSTSGSNGGGLYLNGSSSATVTVTMDDNTIEYNTAGSTTSHHGGGMYINHATVNITSCAINNNTVTGKGGGIYITGSESNVTIENSTASAVAVFSATGTTTINNNNSAQYGGGVNVDCSYSTSTTNSTKFTMNDGEITGNTAAIHGGGFCASGNGSINLIGGTIYNNSVTGTSSYGSEVRLVNSGGITISDEFMIYNDADASNSVSITATANINIDRILSYDANGGTGDVPSSSSSDNTTSNSEVYTVTVEENTFTAPTSITDYDLVFGGWNTKADGTGTNYFPGEEISIYTSTVLYANWKEAKPYELTLDYNYPDGTTETKKVDVTFGSAVTGLQDPTFSDTDATFKGWFIGDEQIENDDIWAYEENKTATANWNLWYVDTADELQYAVDNANEGDTIKITNDIDLTSTITADVSNARDVTLTFIGEKTDGSKPIISSGSASTAMFNIGGTGNDGNTGIMTLTFDNISFNVEKQGIHVIASGCYGGTSARLTIQNCEFTEEVAGFWVYNDDAGHIVNSTRAEYIVFTGNTVTGQYAIPIYCVLNRQLDLTNSLYEDKTNTAYIEVTNNIFSGDCGSEVIQVFLTTTPDEGESHTVIVQSNIFNDTGSCVVDFEHSKTAVELDFHYNVMLDVTYAIRMNKDTTVANNFDTNYNYYESNDEGTEFKVSGTYTNTTIDFDNYYKRADIPKITVTEDNLQLDGFDFVIVALEGEEDYYTGPYYYVIAEENSQGGYDELWRVYEEGTEPTATGSTSTYDVIDPDVTTSIDIQEDWYGKELAIYKVSTDPNIPTGALGSTVVDAMSLLSSDLTVQLDSTDTTGTEVNFPSIVTFDIDGNTTSIDSQTVVYNGYATEPTPAPSPTTGYSFSGWYTAESGGEKWTFASNKVTENITLYARWTINKYTVTFDSNGGTDVDSQDVDYDGKVSEPDDPTKDSTVSINYAFAGWYTDESLTTTFDFDNTTITGDITLYAKWTETDMKYTVQFMTTKTETTGTGETTESDFTYIEYQSNELSYGDKITLPTEDPKLDDYVFGGWYTGVYNEETGEYESQVVTDETLCTSDMTIYANWIKIKIDVDVNVNVDVDVDTGDNKEAERIRAEMEAIEAFNDTQNDPSDEFAWYTIDMTGTIITAKVDASGNLTEEEEEINIYEVTGPYGNLAPIEVLINFDMAGKENLRVYRYHDETLSDAEVIDPDVYGDTDESGNVTLFEEVEDQQIATNDSFYSFSIYQNSVASVYFSDIVLVNSDTETYGNVALYSGKFCTYAIGYDVIHVTFDANEGSVASEGFDVEDDGTLLELPTPTRSGYIFEGWTTIDGDVVTTDTVFETSTTIYAQWSKDSSSTTYYDITISNDGSGTISPDGGSGYTLSVASNGSQTFTFNPAIGYKVTDVLVNGISVGSVSKYAFSNVTSNQTLHVVFSETDEHVNPQTGVSLEKEDHFVYMMEHFVPKIILQELRK